MVAQHGEPAVRGTLTSLSLSVLLPSLATSIANVGLPTMAESFGASFQQVQWIVLAYLLAITTLVVGAGRLGDLVGRRRLLLAGILTFTTASLLCGVAPTLELLVAARALQGLGAAAMLALTMAFVAQTIPQAKTGRAMGLLGTMSAVGTALGPSLGGLLIAGFGWPAIFLGNVPLGVLALVLAYRSLPADGRRPTAGPGGFDYPGTLLLVWTLGIYALAMTTGADTAGPLTGTLLVAAAAGLALFVLAETKVASPLIRLAILRDPGLDAGMITSALVSTVMMTTLVVGPFYLAQTLGLAPASLGLVMSAGPLVAALVGTPAGRAVDRFGATRTAVAGLIGALAGCIGLSATPVGWGVPGYVAPLVVLTAGYALFQAANNTAVMAGASPNDRGLVSGMANLSRNLGLITGASLMGTVFAYAAGASDVTGAGPQDIASGTRWAFAIGAALIAIGLAVAAGVRRSSTRGTALSGILDPRQETDFSVADRPRLHTPVPGKD
jgi:EmrB/QacA subfamily drug resistance transporter